MSVAISSTPKIAPFTVVCDSTNREHWLRQRSKYLGASETSAVLGTDPWRSQLEVWVRKTESAEIGFEESEWIFWGLELENSIISGYGKRARRASIPFGLMIASVRWPWLSATPDALTTDNPEAAKRALPITRVLGQIRTAIAKKQPTEPLTAELVDLCDGWWPLQTKNIGFGAAEHWIEGVPLYYRVQCTQEAMVFGAMRTTGAALIAGQRLAWDDVDIDMDGILERQIVNLTRAFWHDNVLARVQPAVDGSESARSALAALYPVEKPETIVQLGHDMMELAYLRQKIKCEIDAQKQHLMLVENQLKEAIGVNARVIFPDGSGLTYKLVRKKEYVVAAQEYRELRHKKAKGTGHESDSFEELLGASSLGKTKRTSKKGK